MTDPNEPPQPSNIPSQQFKDNYENIFGPRDRRTESGVFAMIGGKLTRVNDKHGQEKTCRGAISEKNPLRSESMGVLPHMAKEFNEGARRSGTGARYCEKTGDCVVTSDGSRNREMERRGMFDKDAGYGQRAR